MPFLVAAVVLIGLLCLFNLVLTFGMMRRLRGAQASPAVLGVGERIGEFATSTVAGEPLTNDRLDAETLVAFFSPDCAPCRTKLPRFVEHARGSSPERVLGVVVGSPAETAEFVERLAPVATVVVEAPDDELATAFHVRSFPTMLRVAPTGDGLVVTDNNVRLRRPAPVG